MPGSEVGARNHGCLSRRVRVIALDRSDALNLLDSRRSRRTVRDMTTSAATSDQAQLTSIDFAVLASHAVAAILDPPPSWRVIDVGSPELRRAALRIDADLVAVTSAEAEEPDVGAWLQMLGEAGCRTAVVSGGMDTFPRHTANHESQPNPRPTRSARL